MVETGESAKLGKGVVQANIGQVAGRQREKCSFPCSLQLFHLHPHPLHERREEIREQEERVAGRQWHAAGMREVFQPCSFLQPHPIVPPLSRPSTPSRQRGMFTHPEKICIVHGVSRQSPGVQRQARARQQEREPDPNLIKLSICLICCF